MKKLLLAGILALVAVACAGSTSTADDGKWTYLGSKNGNSIYRLCDGNVSIYYYDGASAGGYTANLGMIAVIGEQQGGPCVQGHT
jgi:ABC-type glycerol-3-phosphate transport system substrate-binding protein